MQVGHKPYQVILITLLSFLSVLILIQPVQAKSKQKLPKWVSDDCSKREGSYYFVGYGEGQNSATASRNALISSRQNALTCLFGGTITSNISIKENNTELAFDSVTDLELDYSYVNWAGWQQVSERNFALNERRTKLYIQYKWSADSITAEKDRLDKMAAKIAETKAQAQEIRVQRSVIKQQEKQLETLDVQARQLAQIKSASDKAVARLAQINQNRKAKKESIVSVISNLYCGITVDELSQIFREPDRMAAPNTAKYISNLQVSWMDYVVVIPASYVYGRLNIESYEFTLTYLRQNYRAVRRAIGDWSIKSIKADKGLTRRGYDLCK